MSNESPVTRANLLAQMASDPSVSTDVLADQERQFDESRLSGPPPVTHLTESEAPAYVLTNAKRGIGLGSKRRTTEPDSDRGTICLVTGERVLCLIGMEPEDEVLDVPYKHVASVSGHTGWLANRLEIRTPRKAYHIWVERNSNETVMEAESFIKDRMAQDPEELSRQDGASRVTYRGSPADSQADEGASTNGSSPGTNGSSPGTNGSSPDESGTSPGKSGSSQHRTGSSPEQT